MRVMNIAGGAQQLGAPEIVRAIEVIQVVVELFRYEDPRWVDGYRNGAIRVLVAQPQLGFVAEDHEHRLEGKRIGGLPQGLETRIEQFPDMAVQDMGLRRVLPAAAIFLGCRQPNSEDIGGQGQIDHAGLDALSGAVLHHCRRCLDTPLVCVQYWVFGDVADSPRHRTLAVQGALWPLEYFDPVEVEGPRIHLVEPRERQRRFIQVHPDQGAVAILITQTPHEDGIGAGAVLAGSDSRHGERQVLNGPYSELREVGAADRRDAHRHIHQALLTLLRGDDDFLETRFCPYCEPGLGKPD